MILVTGATGLVGGEVVRQLSARGVPLRALVRSPEKGAALAGPGVQAVVGDFAKPETLGPALEGVTRALLISHHDLRQVELQGNFVEAARRAGRVPVVKLSGLATSPDSPSQSGRWHAETESHIRHASLPWTFLHPPYFMQNLLRSAPAIAAHGVLTAAMKDGRIAMVDARDVAAVAVAALTSPDHEGRTYVVTGPDALSHADVAAILSKAVGREITYRDTDLDALRAQIVASGAPPWLVEVRMEFTTVLREGFAAAVTDAVLRTTGRPPRSFAAFAAEHAARFRSPASA
jgi:uncharacterized protein YbjT (DUF2867 family)